MSEQEKIKAMEAGLNMIDEALKIVKPPELKRVHIELDESETMKFNQRVFMTPQVQNMVFDFIEDIANHDIESFTCDGKDCLNQFVERAEIIRWEILATCKVNVLGDLHD